MKSSKKQVDGEKKLKARTAAMAALKKLNGKSIANLTKAEQSEFLTAIGKLAGIVDDTGVVAS
jgi:hypothetical protein